MGRTLTITCSGEQYDVSPEKLDRRKLYGWIENKYVDNDDRPCTPATLDDTGTVIIPKGELAMGTLSQDGRWLEKSELMAVDAEGNPIEKVPSTFSEPVELSTIATATEYLDHVIQYVYQLSGDELDALIAKVKAIDGFYTFPFSYRTGYAPSSAFLIENAGTLFMTVGRKIEIEYIGRVEAPVEVVEEEEEEDDDIDFGMMM